MMLVLNVILYFCLIAFSSILSMATAYEKLALLSNSFINITSKNEIPQTRLLLPYKPFKKPSKTTNSSNQGVIFNKPSKLSINNKLTTTPKPSKLSLKPTVQNIVTTSTIVPVQSTPSISDNQVITTETIDISETKTDTQQTGEVVTAVSEPTNTEQNEPEGTTILNELSFQPINEITDIIEEYNGKRPSEANLTINNSTSPVTETVYTPSPVTENDSWVTANSNEHTTEKYCKNGNGFYDIPGQCDTYIECRKLAPTTHVCPDGLLFNPTTIWPNYPCAYPSEVLCDGEIIQEQVSTKSCEHQYGIFASPNDCSQYVVCREGIASVMNCPPGLAFNTETNSCDWPENIPDCTPAALVENLCSLAADTDSDYKYRYKKSCREYILCHHGNSHLLKCDFGFSFDETVQICVDSEKVRNCEKI